MMKKITFAFVLCVSAMHLYAHELWLNAYPIKNKLQVEIGYGHGFPITTKIPESSIDIFEAIQVKYKNQLLDVKNADKKINHIFKTTNDIQPGTYLVVDKYKPNLWSVSKTNFHDWKRLSKKENKDAEFCMLKTMTAKTIVNIGNKDFNDQLVRSYNGGALEFIPQIDPTKLHIGDSVEILLLYKGKPYPNAKVEIDYATSIQEPVKTTGHHHHHHHDAKDKIGLNHSDAVFSTTTDKNGKFLFEILNKGYWNITAKHTAPYKDPTECDLNLDRSSLTFEIK